MRRQRTATVQQTVQQTVTSIAPAPVATPTTTAPADTSGDTTWIWFVVAAAVVVAGVALLVRRRHHGGPANPAPEARKQLLFTVVETWIAQGWAVESEREDETVLANGPSRMLVNVDAEGHVSSHRLADA